eukprot:gene11969-13206_t
MVFAVVAGISVLGLVYVVLHYVTHLWSLCKYPPGPTPMPIIGNVYQLGSHPYSMLKDLATVYGDVFSISLGTKRVVVVNSVEQAREALLNKSVEFAGRPQDVYTAGIITRGFKDIAFSDFGPTWQATRKLAHSSLKLYGNGMEKMEEHIQAEADDLYERLDAQAGKPYNPHSDFALAVINIICSMVFGQRYRKDDPEFLDVVKYNNLITSGFSHIGPVAFLPWLRFFPNPGYKKVTAGIQIRDVILRRQLNRHKSSFDSNNIRDLTDALIAEAIKESPLPEKNKKYPTDDHLEMIIHDANKAVQEKAAEELLSVMNRDERRLPSLKDREKLPYVCAVINEVLRCSSVIPLGVPHKTTSDTTLAGYSIPKNTHIVFNLWSIHRDERQWENPDDFRPERWLDEQGCMIPEREKSFMPFSAGRRVCLGEPLARTEVFLFLTRILCKYSIDKAPGQPLPSLDGNRSVIHTPKPFEVVFNPRPVQTGGNA